MTQIRGIRKQMLHLLLKMGESQHPREFFAVLIENEGIIEEMELAPGTISGESSASFSPFMLPITTNVAGSAHSHPNGVLTPSKADLNFFPKIGRYHIIVGYPYSKDDWRCYSADGRPYGLEVIP